jgi:hypothetical protein
MRGMGVIKELKVPPPTIPSVFRTEIISQFIGVRV